MGHVPPGPLPEERQGAHLPRREHRGAGAPRSGAAEHRRRLGRLGESLAASFLARRGAEILARNLRSGRGEVDVLARIGGHLVAVEVKTRRGVDPLTQITEDKARRLREAARRLRPRPDRVDVVTVTLTDRGALLRWVQGVA